jgi:hypothetical protein
MVAALRMKIAQAKATPNLTSTRTSSDLQFFMWRHRAQHAISRTRVLQRVEISIPAATREDGSLFVSNAQFSSVRTINVGRPPWLSYDKEEVRQ